MYKTLTICLNVSNVKTMVPILMSKLPNIFFALLISDEIWIRLG